MTFGIILLALVLIFCIAGSLIPQGESVSFYAQKYSEYHGWILRLGLDNIFRSWYFIAVTALLCLNLTLCSIVRIKKVIKASKNAVENAFALNNTVFVSEDGLIKLDKYLLETRCKKEERDGISVYSKNSFGRFGTFIVHLAILLTIIFGSCALYLPQITDKTCYPGNSLVMDDGTEIYVDSFSILDTDGTLNYSSNIRVTLPDGRDSGIQNISVNHPLSFSNYKVYQQTYGTAGSITATNLNTGGQDTVLLDDVSFLSLDGVNGLWFEAVYPDYQRDEDGNFTLVTSTVGRYENPVYQVLTASEGEYTPILAFPGESIELFDVKYTINDPVEYPGLRIKYTPPVVNLLLCIAFALMIAGLYVTFFMPPVLVKADREGYTVAGPKPEGTRLALREILGKYERTEI